ncbi:MAG: hypothetical protein J0H09_20085 [Burkholderiales bacterium]|nr:hypothetical protein [Burkholderiales bacterium]
MPADPTRKAVQKRQIAAGAQGNGSILFDAVHAAPSEGIAFDVWHDREHLPALRATLPGAAEQRYASASRHSLVSIFELPQGTDASRALSAAATVTAPAGTVSRIERFVAVPMLAQLRADAGELATLPARAAIAYPVFFGVPPEHEADFDGWYDEEHLPILLGCPQWLGCRRFKLQGAHAQGHTHLAMHYLQDLRALQSPERDAARDTPWRDRLAAGAWFRGDYRVYHRLA